MQRDSPGDGGQPVHELEPLGPFLFLPLLFLQAGGMDLSRVGEKIFSSVRSTRSLGLLPSTSDRPEVPERAVAAAAAARALAGLPPHERIALASNSKKFTSIYGIKDQLIKELEEEFYEEDFDAVKYILEHIECEESDAAYFEKKATLRLAQLDKIAERLSRHVVEHHEELVKGMQLVMELQKDLKIATVICMNGRRHIASSMHEVSRELVVHSNSKKKQALLDMLPILSEILHAMDMQLELETLVEEGNYFRAFALLPEYLQLLDSYLDLCAVKEMYSGVEAWLERTLQKLDALLLGVCQKFSKESYITAVDAYALVGDINGLAEKIQSFFMQDVLSETHALLKDIVLELSGCLAPRVLYAFDGLKVAMLKTCYEKVDCHKLAGQKVVLEVLLLLENECLDVENESLKNRLTYSDLCEKIPESKFQHCLLKTLESLFNLMCSYYKIMSFKPKREDFDYPSISTSKNVCTSQSLHKAVQSDAVQCGSIDSFGLVLPVIGSPSADCGSQNCTASDSATDNSEYTTSSSYASYVGSNDASTSASCCNLPFYHLRKEATSFVSQTLDRRRESLWQLVTSRISVLLSSPAVYSMSTFQFLRNYEDLNAFVLAGEAFCGVQASEFRTRLKTMSEKYFAAIHRQNVYALRMVMEKETWLKLSAESMQLLSLAGLMGDGSPLIVPSSKNTIVISAIQSEQTFADGNENQKNGFCFWLSIDNPFSSKLSRGSKELSNVQTLINGSSESCSVDTKVIAESHIGGLPTNGYYVNHKNDGTSILEDENEDLLADFIDEDSQLPSRISKPVRSKNRLYGINDDVSAQTGSSICLLRLMDKYARLMQKLEIVNVDIFKGIRQLFGIFLHFIFEIFCQKDSNQSFRLKSSLSKIVQDCDQWIIPQNHSFSSSPNSINTSIAHIDVMPTVPSGTVSGTTFGLMERCVAAETVSFVAQILRKSKPHFQSMLFPHNAALIDDFYGNLVDSVPDLIEHIHKTTARMLLHIDGYADKIANAKWELKDLGLEHNGYVDLLLGEFKHYKTRLSHGGIAKEFQDLLLVFGLENVAEVLTEGLSRVRRCSDEGRVLMTLDLQVLINGLQHFTSMNVKPKLQIVETFIKAFYLPETEYVHWARAHPEYSKSQIVGLVNLVAAMKGWKRKTRLEVLEKIESGN